MHTVVIQDEASVEWDTSSGNEGSGSDGDPDGFINDGPVEQGTPPPMDWTPQGTTSIRMSTPYDTLAKPLGISPIQGGTAKTSQRPIAGQANTQPTKPAEEPKRPQITPEKEALYMRRLVEGYDIPDEEYQEWVRYNIPNHPSNTQAPPTSPPPPTTTSPQEPPTPPNEPPGEDDYPTTPPPLPGHNHHPQPQQNGLQQGCHIVT